jgi:hypothetical protein
VLRESDVPGAVKIGLIDQTAGYALDSQYDVILEAFWTPVGTGRCCRN